MRKWNSSHESVHFYKNEALGLSAIIAVHTTYSGVSLGGCRIHSFDSQEEALKDVLRLSEHMTYKSLLCDLHIGGGKSVIIIPKGSKKKTPQLLKAFAEAVNSLQGHYIVSVDMGSDSADMDILKQNTDHVVGYDDSIGGAGDPGVYTAHGVMVGMKSVAQEKWNTPSLKGKKILVVGLGNTGAVLCENLIKEGAELIVSDIDKDKIQKIKNLNGSIKVVTPEEAHRTPCDIFSPCATGDIFNEKTIPELQCKVIVGAANNQLSSMAMGKEIFKRGITYLPDFAVNSGGLIGVVSRGLRKKSLEETYKQIQKIDGLIQNILQESHRKNTPPSQIAYDMAQKKYEKIYSRGKV